MTQFEKFSMYPKSDVEYTLSEKIVYEIINDFYDRKGFDWFWDDIDDDSISEIISDQINKVSHILIDN